MIDKRIIINVALGIIIAFIVLFSGWYVLDTRQMALQNSNDINEIVNFINQQLMQTQGINDVGDFEPEI